MGNDAGRRSYSVKLRWRDLDNQGHVYHATFLTLLDEARSAFLGDMGVREAGAYVLAHIELDFLQQITCEHGAVEVGFAVEKIGRTSIGLREEMRSGGVVKAHSSSVIVLWDRDTGRSRLISDPERSALEAVSRGETDDA